VNEPQFQYLPEDWAEYRAKHIELWQKIVDWLLNSEAGLTAEFGISALKEQLSTVYCYACNLSTYVAGDEVCINCPLELFDSAGDRSCDKEYATLVYYKGSTKAEQIAVAVKFRDSWPEVQPEPEADCE